MEEGEVEGKPVHSVEDEFSYSCYTICAAYLIDGKYVSNGVKVRSLELCGLFNIHAFEQYSTYTLLNIGHAGSFKSILQSI
jgi:hypothetical protein